MKIIKIRAFKVDRTAEGAFHRYHALGASVEDRRDVAFEQVYMPLDALLWGLRIPLKEKRIYEKSFG